MQPAWDFRLILFWIDDGLFEGKRMFWHGEIGRRGAQLCGRFPTSKLMQECLLHKFETFSTFSLRIVKAVENFKLAVCIFHCPSLFPIKSPARSIRRHGS